MSGDTGRVHEDEEIVREDEARLREDERRVREDAGQLADDEVRLREDERRDKDVVISVNRKSVTLDSRRVTGMDIKQAAIAQGVEIREDFLLTFEAHGGKEARVVGDDEMITVTAHSVFTANDGDDDS